MSGAGKPPGGPPKPGNPGYIPGKPKCGGGGAPDESFPPMAAPELAKKAAADAAAFWPGEENSPNFF